MEEKSTSLFGVNLETARIKSKLTQVALAKKARINRTTIRRMEIGIYEPRLGQILRLAEALKVPIQQFLTGRRRPPIGIKGIAFELFHLGIGDYVVEGAAVPGAFRRREQVVVLALQGDRPETRLITAMPVVLATHPLDVGLTLAYANLHDRRVRGRVAWLSAVTLALARLNTFPVTLRTQAGLEKVIKSVKRSPERDDLGHPGTGRPGPLWQQWNIGYGGTMQDFLNRAHELAADRPPSDEE